MTTKRRGRVEIKPSKNKQTYFVVKGANGEPLATGETYKRLSGTKKGAEALKKALQNAKVVIKGAKKKS